LFNALYGIFKLIENPEFSPPGAIVSIKPNEIH